MKAIVIKGCADCPYRFEWHDLKDYCGYKNAENPIEVNPQSETPHPNCKLPDLPNEEEIQAINKQVQDMFIYPYMTEKEANLVGQVYGFTMTKFKNILNKINGG
jgi:hypothetical protein